MKANIRKATLDDLETLIRFTAEEAKEAEGISKIPNTLKRGIKAALEDNSKSIYWIIFDENNVPFGDDNKNSLTWGCCRTRKSRRKAPPLQVYKERPMKTIGLLGGMSWESTLGYYRAINEGVKNALGGLHSAKIALYSVDFEPIEQLQHAGDWEGTTKILSEAAKNVQAAGADFLLICTNTMHKVAPEIEAAIHIPLLHIADATAEILVNEGVESVGLLGTAFTMEQDFYKGRLTNNYGLHVLVPNEDDRCIVHKVIYQELCLGKIESDSKEEYIRIIDALAAKGAQAVILGCTEIGMLVNQADTNVRLIDTTAIHAKKAVEYATT